MALRTTATSRGKSRGGIVGVVFLAALALLSIAGAVNAQTIEIVKDIYVDEPAMWAAEYRSEWQFNVTGPTTRTETIGGDETTGAFSVIAGSYTIVESPGTGFRAIDYTTSWEYTINGTPTGSGTGMTVSGLSVGASDVVVVTFTNTWTSGALSVQIDPNRDGVLYVRDDTLNKLVLDGYVDTTPTNVDVLAYHDYSVWVTKNGHDLTVNNWPKNESGVPGDWSISADGTVASGPVQAAAEPVHFDSGSIDLSITKECHDLVAGALGALAYTIDIAHISGWNDADSVTVEDQLPTGLSNATYTLDGADMGAWPGSGVLTLGTVLAGATHEIEIYADVAFDLTSIGTNTAEVSDPDDVYPDNDSDSCTNSLEPRGQIIVEKTTVPSGNTTTFSFTDDLGSFDLAGDGASESFILSPGTYDVSETPLFGWTLTGVSDNDPDGGSSSAGYTATVDLDAGEIITVTFSNSIDQADLRVEKTDDPDPVVVGQNLTYTIVVTNDGPDDATGVEVADTLPAGVIYVSDTPSQGTFSSSTNVWTVGSLANGASATLELVVEVGSGAGTSITNTACVTGDQVDLNSANDCDDETTTVYHPSYTISKSVTDVGGDGPGGSIDAAGDIVSYEIVVINTGNQPLTGVSVSDPLLEGANGTLVGPTESMSSDGVLEVGETWTYAGTYTAQQADLDNDGGGDSDIDNTATVTCNELPSEES
ncbi:hypothetical protein ACFLTM_04615, partial [Candidatus Bipolaricaulota bacterium]